MNKRILPFVLVLLLLLPASALASTHLAATPSYNILPSQVYLNKLVRLGDRLFALCGDMQGGNVLMEVDVTQKALRPIAIKEAAPGEMESSLSDLHELFSDENTLLGFDINRMTLFRLDISQQPATFTALLTMDDWADSYPRAMAFSSPYLYAAFNDGVARVDIKTRETTRLSSPEARSLAPYKDGTLIGAVVAGGRGDFKHQIWQYDFENDHAHSLGEPDFPTFFGHNLLYEPERDLILLGDSSQLVAWQPGQEKVSLITQYPRGDVLGMALLPGQLVAISVSDLLAIRSLDPDMQAQSTLTLLDPIGRGHEYKGFLQDAQGVDLVFYPLNEAETNTRFINDMLTRDAQIDVYVLSDSNLLSQIKQKGFALPLGADEELKHKAEQMEAPFLEAFQKDQDLLVFPKELYVNLPVVDTALLQQMGLPLPTTYLEYFKLCETFLTEHQKDHPDVLVLPFDQGMGLVEVLSHAAQDMQRNGQPLRFDTLEIRELVAQMHKVAMLQNDLPQQVNSWLFYAYYLPTLPEGREYLLMRLKEDMQPSLMIGHEDLRYFVINPYTKNPEAARKLVASYAASLPTPLDILLNRARTQPVQQPDYPQRQSYLVDQLALVEEAQKKAEGAEKAELIKQQDALQMQLLNLEKDERWWFDESAMKRVRELAPRVYLPGFNPILLLAREYPDFFLEYQTNPAFDPARFVSQLDSMVNTAMLEHQ